MPKPWRLTPDAEASFADIAEWTEQNFGSRQTKAYGGDLIEACQGIAERRLARSCRLLLGEETEDDLKFVRSGEHFIVFLEEDHAISILEFFHVRSDLPRKLADLIEARESSRR